jgi:hypothetical protein
MLITPYDYKESYNKPLVFLAGPIQGAPEWQKEAVALLSGSEEYDIANPRKTQKPEVSAYEKQVDWETYHLRKAALSGVILFWLAAAAYEVPGRAYGQTSRFELAEWLVHSLDTPISFMVVGIEKGFGNERYIRRRCSQDYPELKLYSSLAETCEQAKSLLL